MAAVAPFDTRSDLSEGERLGEQIAELNAYLTVTEAHFLELLREFDEQRYWEALGFRTCSHWLNFKCGIGFNAARERLRMAHALVLGGHFKLLKGAGHDADRDARERGPARAPSSHLSLRR